MTSWKDALLRRSWEHFSAHASERDRGELEAFTVAPDNARWLWDWTLYAALKRDFGGRPWTDWEDDLVRRDTDALRLASLAVEGEMRYQSYLQFLFFRQWSAPAPARPRARRSASWATFRSTSPTTAPTSGRTRSSSRSTRRCGRSRSPACRPTTSRATGQLWGNPLYRWDRMEEDGYAWWVDRIAAGLAVCDLLRIDHFRAFSAYWSVPASESTALNGRWVPGPGRKLFDAARRALGGLPLLAEDLGDISPEVRQLLALLRIPGMKILQFGFYGADSEYLPHRIRATAWPTRARTTTTRRGVGTSG